MKEKDEKAIALISTITYEDEPLKKTFTFEFEAENPYFSNTTLKKVIYF